MKVNAIVYQSNAGHTRCYAEMFSQMAGLPAFSLDEAGSKVRKGEEVLFFGWLMAGNVVGFKKAARHYNVNALCAIGMGRPDDGQIVDVVKKYNFSPENAFYLQGGFDFSKLHGIYKFMMKTLSVFLGPALEKKQNKTPEEMEMLDMIKGGGDYVRRDNLIPVLNWFESK